MNNHNPSPEGAISHGAPIGPIRGIWVVVDNACGNEHTQNASTSYLCRQPWVCRKTKHCFAKGHSRITIFWGQARFNTPIRAPCPSPPNVTYVQDLPLYANGATVMISMNLRHRIYFNFYIVKTKLCSLHLIILFVCPLLRYTSSPQHKQQVVAQ